MKWEYLVFWVDTKARLEDRLNEIGGRGWELVADHEGYLIFKRLRADSQREANEQS